LASEIGRQNRGGDETYIKDRLNGFGTGNSFVFQDIWIVW